MNRAGAILRLATLPRSRPSPLPQCGRGAGGEGYPRCGRGRGESGPHLPPCPFLSHQGQERGDEPSRGDPAAGNATALTFPPCPPFLSHAAGEEGGERPSPSPLPSSSPIRGEKGGRAGGVLRGRGDEPSRGDPAAGNATAFTTLPAPAVRERGRG